MTTPHRTLQEAAQMALDALLIGYHRGTHDAIAALREALAQPVPEPVALESVHLTRDTRGMCVVRVNGRVAIRDNGDIIDHMATLEWFAAPPAAPADDHATPSGGQEAGPQEDRIEAAYWRFDARHKGYSQWKTAPMSERDAFKAEMRNALEAEKVRAEMRLVARGWRRPDAPAAPDHLRDVAEKAAPTAPAPDGWVMVPRKELGDGISLLHQAMVGACDCLTKTHEAKYHAESCFYRRLFEQCDKLEATIAASPAAPVVRDLQQGVLDQECNYMAPMGRVCNKCGRIHRGITGGKP